MRVPNRAEFFVEIRGAGGPAGRWFLLQSLRAAGVKVYAVKDAERVRTTYKAMAKAKYDRETGQRT